MLQRLLHGERLPHTGDSSFRQVESKIAPFKFDTSKPITEPANLKVRKLEKKGVHVVYDNYYVVLQIRRGIRDNLRIIFLHSGQRHVVTPY